MRYVITEATFADPAFRDAFRAYFAELGITVRDWEGLFRYLDASGSCVLVHQHEDGRVIAFLLHSTKTMSSGFYTAQIGCIDELYVAPDCRRQGLGAALLSAAEELLTREGCGYVFLTSDSAPAFFTRQGYSHQPSVTAINGDPVFVKSLEMAFEP